MGFRSDGGKPDNTHARWAIVYFQSVDAIRPTLSPAQMADRGNALKQLKAEVPNLATTEFDHLNRLCSALPIDRTDLVSDLFPALNHLRLPDAVRKAREARIDQALALYFAGMPLPTEVATGIEHIKLIAPLAPDAFLEGMVSGLAARLQMACTNIPAWAIYCVENVNGLSELTDTLGTASRSEEDRLLVTTLFSRPWGERLDFLTLLEWAAQSKLVEAVCRTELALRGKGLLLAAEGDVLVKVLQACRAAALDGSMPAEIGAVVANQVALAQMADLARLRFALAATIEATRRGVSLGARVDAQNLAAISAAGLAFWQQLLRMTPERLRVRDKLSKAPVARPGTPATEPVDLDPVHAWSVSRLLRWIEGPILETAPAPLERAKFVLKEKATREDARVKTKMPVKAALVDQDLTGVDVDIALQNALRTTAEFFIGDIEDMRFKAEALVEGKRRGGVINCRLKRSDWPWVAEQYHRCWLPWNRQIMVDGVLRVLQPDQALGLHVTGKSLSGYEFDVSVHLWLRRAGREGAPGTSMLPFSPMNNEDWIDTLTPCAVLHVPSAT